MAKKKPAPKTTAPVERPVMVTTAHRGVFFGYAADTSGEVIKLARVRMCIYWSKDCKGILGLTDKGPSASCKIGRPCSAAELRNITAVFDVSPEAAQAWEAAPWA